MKTSHLLLGSLLFLATGCEQIDYLDLSPKFVTLRRKNDEVWLSAHAFSHTGVPSPKASIEWSVTDPTIAQIDAKGRIRPLKSGKTEAVARHEAISSSIPVEVLFSEKFVVEPNPIILVEGAPPVEFKVQVFDYQGRLLTDRRSVYTSKNPEVVRVGQNAVFPVAPGKTVVEVQVEGLKQLVEVSVEAEKKTRRTN